MDCWTVSIYALRAGAVVVKGALQKGLLKEVLKGQELQLASTERKECFHNSFFDVF